MSQPMLMLLYQRLLLRCRCLQGAAKTAAGQIFVLLLML
jgi:hypothetical protein